MTRYKDMKDFIKMTNMVFLIETVLCICVLKILVMNMQRVIHSFSDRLTVLSGNKSDQSSFHWSTTKADHCRWRGRIQLWWRHAKQGNRALENDQREVSHTWHKMHTGGMDFKKSYALKILFELEILVCYKRDSYYV